MLLIRLIIVGIIFLVVKSSYCQVDSFVMIGRIEGVNKGYVQIWEPKSDSTFHLTHNKVPIVKGEFTIKGYLKFPSQTALIAFADGNVVLETEWFFIDPGIQRISIDTSNSRVNISSTSKTFNEYIQKFKPVEDSLIQTYFYINKELENHVESATISAIVDSLNRLKRVLSAKSNIFLLEYIMENPESYVGIAKLSVSIDALSYSSFHETAFSFLDEKLRQSAEGQKIIEKINFVKKLSEGLKFPAFEILDINKQSSSLYDKELNKFTLIDFWFHNCGYCIAQFPQLKKIYYDFENKGFEIIGITVDDEKYELDWKKTIDKYELPWSQYWDINGFNCLKYLINKFPTNFLLNEKGEIIAKNISMEALNNFLNKNL